METKTGGIAPNRHSLLPPYLNAEELAQWIDSNAKDRFTDSQKHIFTPEEVAEFEHESSVNGREAWRLEDIVSLVKDHVVKGGEEALSIEIPATVGTKKLKEFRRQNDDMVETGHELIDTKIYGIIDTGNARMEFFDIEGNHIADRSRELSAKEKHIHLGMFQPNKSVMFVQNGARSNVDTDTGEMTDNEEKDGTNG